MATLGAGLEASSLKSLSETWVGRIARRIVNFAFALGVLHSASVDDLKSLFFCIIFEVHGTIPWGLYLVGKGLKYFNSLVRRRDGTMNRKLADLFEIKVPPTPRPVNGVSSKDVGIDVNDGIWARIFSPSMERTDEPKSKLRRPVLVYYHGGGFGLFSPDFIYMDSFCRSICRTCNVVVVSVNYRLAPEYRYPTAYDDSFRALQWLQSPESFIYLPPIANFSQIFLAGDSAGANIVHSVACRVAEYERAGADPIPIRGMILLQPYFGSEARTQTELELVDVPIICLDATDWYWEAFLPQGSNRDHPACNVFGPQALDISHLRLPPIFLVTSTFDILQDHQANYASRIRQMGKSIIEKCYNGGIHGFYFLEIVKIKLAQECLKDINEFIESCI